MARRGFLKNLRAALAVALSLQTAFSGVPTQALAAMADADGGGQGATVVVSQEATGAAADEGPTGEGSSEGTAGGDAAADDAQAPAETTGTDAATGAAEPTGEAAPDEQPLQSDLTALPLTAAPELNLDEYRLLADDPAPAPADDETADLPSEGDGSKIEGLTVEWATKDTGSEDDLASDEDKAATLTLVPGDDSAFSVVARVNLSLSGEYDYGAGDIQVSVPKYIFSTRDGERTGTMELSVPEAPDSRATFSYTDMGEYYLLTNTRLLSAATDSYFELAYRALTPHTIEDLSAGYQSDAFRATVTVDTHAGNQIQATSNDITCRIDTSARVTSAYKDSRGIMETWQDSWPSQLKPENDGDYLYADWYAYAYASGNQPFTLTLADDATTDGAPHSAILGYRLTQTGQVVAFDDAFDGDGRKTFSATVYGTPTYRDGTCGYVHIYVAYPKDDVLMDGSENTFQNKVTYTLTSADDRQETSASGSSTINYSVKPFMIPEGHFNVFKYSGGSYDYALNTLRDGEAVDVSYRTQTVGFGYPWTGVDDGDGSWDESDFGKKDYEMVTADPDTGTNLAFDYDDTEAGDYELRTLRISRPTVYDYRRYTAPANGYYESAGITGGGVVRQGLIPAGSWGYAVDGDDADVPDIEVYGHAYGESDDDGWVHYATVSWKSGTAVATCERGATAEGSTITFPAGVTHWRCVVRTRAAGVFYWAYPTYRIFPTEHVVSQVEQLFSETDNPHTVATNTVVMDAYEYDATGTERSFLGEWSPRGGEWGPKTASDRLSGATLSVRQTVTTARETNDTSNQLVRLHYTTGVEEQSNLTSIANYNEAVAKGIFGTETSGTFYALLPPDTTPDLTSISLRSGDSVRAVHTVRNYKGSGRTLLVVEASLTPHPTYKGTTFTGEAGYCDTPTLSFDAVYSWESMLTYGRDLNLLVAFESGNDTLGTVRGYSGEPDDPSAGNNSYTADAFADVTADETPAQLREWMRDLDPTTDKPAFAYAHANVELVSVTTATTELAKRVAVNGDGVYGTGLDDAYPLNVYEGGSYRYQVFQRNRYSEQASGIVFYDKLEAYTPGTNSGDESGAADRGDAQWRGTLVGVDTTQLEAMGVDPVVYYSTAEGLDLQNNGSRQADMPSVAGTDLDLADTSIWSTTPPADLSQVTAVAIDCSRAADGGEFVLGKGESLAAYLDMRAPSGVDASWYDATLADGEAEGDEDGLAGGAHAYNNVSMRATIVGDSDTGSADKLIRYDYTKVGIRPNDVTVRKSWDDDGDRDGIRPDAVTVHLLVGGEQAYDADGNAYTATLSAENGWEVTWPHVSPVDANGDPLYYTLSEDEVAGYRLRTTSQRTPSGTTIRATNAHTTETVDVAGEKVWDDAEDTAGRRPTSVEVSLYQDGTLRQTKTITADADGSWSYSFAGLPKYHDHGVAYDYEVREDAYYPGYVASVAEDGTITNTYAPYGDLTISKAVVGATDAAGGATFSFVPVFTGEDGRVLPGTYAYDVTDASGATLRTGTVESGQAIMLADGQTATVHDLPSESTYEIDEEAAPGFAATDVSGDTGTIRAGQTSAASFTNTYTTTGRAYLTASKALSGRALRNHEFRLQLCEDTDADGQVDEGERQLRVATNGRDGSVSFGALRYGNDDDGQTYHYTISEVVPDDATNADGVRYADATAEQRAAGGFVLAGVTYDGHVEAVSVSVADDGDGTMTCTTSYDADGAAFANAYHATGETTLSAWKTLPGRALTDGEFSFELLDSAGTVVATATSTAAGTITFPALSYDETDAGYTYAYTAREVAGKDATVSYTDRTFSYTVAVSDNGDGTLTCVQDVAETPVFENALVPGTLELWKQVPEGAGSSDDEQEFTFRVRLVAPAGQELPEGTTSFVRLTHDEHGNVVAGEPGGPAAKAAPAGAAALEAALAAAGGAAAYTAPGTSTDEAPASPGGDLLGTLADGLGSLLAPTVAHADERGVTATGTSNTVTWTLYDDGELHLAPTDGVDGTLGNGSRWWYGNNNWPWGSHAADIKSVTVEPGVHANGDLSYFLANCTNLVDISGLANLDVSKTTTMVNTLENCSSLTSLSGLSTWRTSSLTRMDYIFYGCSALTDLTGLADWDVSNVTNMAGPFQYCTSLVSTHGLESWRTGKARDMKDLFNGCTSLTDLSGLADWDVSSAWFSEMDDGLASAFWRCTALVDASPIKNWNVNPNTWIYSMFGLCTSLRTVDMSGWSTPSDRVSRLFWYDRALDTVVLGPNVTAAVVSQLPTQLGYNADGTGRFTGRWVRADNAYGPYTVSQLASAWTGDAIEDMAGTWIAEVTPTSATVRYDANGAAGSMANSLFSLASGYTSEVSPNGFYRFDYEFVGWNTRADGTGHAYQPGTAYAGGDLYNEATGAAATVGDTVTLYAQWRKLDDTVDIQDGTFTVSLKAGEGMRLPDLPAGTGYVVEEQTPAGWVVVAQSGTTGTIPANGTATATVTNEYHPGLAQAQVGGMKLVDGTADATGGYRFQLFEVASAEAEPAEGAEPLLSATDVPGGSFLFDPITYDATGAHHYVIREAAGDDVGMSYDSHLEHVTVTVTDNGDGTRTATVATDDDGVAFENTTLTGTLTLTKVVTGTDDATRDFSFHVSFSDGTSQDVTLKNGESWTSGPHKAGTAYEVTETGLPEGYTLEGIDHGSGTLSEGTTTVTARNAYAATGSVTLSARKAYEGGTLVGSDFSFALCEDADDDGTPDGDALQTATNDASGLVSFAPIAYDQAGTYHYLIREVAGADAAVSYSTETSRVTVIATDDGAGRLSCRASYEGAGDDAGLYPGRTFTNTRKTGSLAIAKEVEDGTSATSATRFSFVVSLRGADGAELVGSYPYTRTGLLADSAATGTVSSGDTVHLAGGETLTIEGLPDGTAYVVRETDVPQGFAAAGGDGSGTVAANGTATASFTNTYSAHGTWTPDVTKLYGGADLAQGQFSFVLLDDEGNVLQTARNGDPDDETTADGRQSARVAFQPVDYTQADDGTTFHYTIEEVADGQRGVSYDRHAVDVAVTVADGGDGTMTVTATYGDEGADAAVFENDWSLELPLTGSAAYATLDVAGLVLVSVSAADLVRRRRRE